MDSSILSGLIGGLIAAALAAVITKAASKKKTNGELTHGLFILILAALCFALAAFAVWAYIADASIREDKGALLSVILLFFGFGIGAVACFAEFFVVSGRFDKENIHFTTPWTGTKQERWQDLVSAEFNKSMYWYTLTFESGKKIRISAYLHGHGEVLSLLNERGFEV